LLDKYTDILTESFLQSFYYAIKDKKTEDPEESILDMFLQKIRDSNDINKQDKQGNTLLHHVMRVFSKKMERSLERKLYFNNPEHFTKTIETLLGYGADVTIKNNADKIPVDELIDGNYSEYNINTTPICNLLRAEQARKNRSKLMKKIFLAGRVILTLSLIVYALKKRGIISMPRLPFFGK
jgi:ankyrin repeat protein